MTKQGKFELFLFLSWCVLGLIGLIVAIVVAESGEHFNLATVLILEGFVYACFLYVILYPCYLLTKFLIWLFRLTAAINHFKIKVVAVLAGISLILYGLNYINYVYALTLKPNIYLKTGLTLLLFIASAILTTGIYRSKEWARRAVIIYFAGIALIIALMLVFSINFWTIPQLALAMFPWSFFLIFFTHPLIKRQFN